MIPLGIAAGHLKRSVHAEPLLQVPPDILKFLTFGSFTPEFRPGNSGTVFWDDDNDPATALNALGLPNCGAEEAREDLLEFGPQIGRNDRVGRVSIAGKTVNDYALLAERFHVLHGSYYYLELNLGCPNVRDDGIQHGIFSFDLKLIEEILQRVWKINDCVGLAIAVKLSVYSDPGLLKEAAAVITNGHVSEVVTCNTFANAVAFNRKGEHRIETTGGYAGLSGKPLKHIALGQVEQFCDVLPKSIHVVGVGGISSGRDVRDMELAGAKSVQIGTAYFRNSDARVFQRIAEEYVREFE